MAATLDFKLTWTLNDFAVPLETKTKSVLDPHHLAEDLVPHLENIDEEVEMSLVSFKDSADMRWFLKALKLGAKWWIAHCGQLPLLLEIRKIIKDQKTTKGGGSRLPRQSDSMVLIKVRERILFVQNLSSCVTLGLRGTPGHGPGAPPGTQEDELGVLQWFVQELQKDVKHLQENPEKPGEDLEEEQGQQAEVEDEDDSDQLHIEECLKDLQKHPSCLSAWWMPSRQCFRIRTKDKRSSDFGVKSLKRKKHSEEGENKFDMALARALEFLDTPGPESPDEPALPESASG